MSCRWTARSLRPEPSPAADVIARKAGTGISLLGIRADDGTREIERARRPISAFETADRVSRDA